MRNKETKWKNSGKFKGDGSCEFTRPPRIPGGRVVRVPPGGSLRRRETDPATGKPAPPSPVSEQCSRPSPCCAPPGRSLLCRHVYFLG